MEIGTEAASEGQMNVNRQDMADVLTATFGQPARAASWISTTPAHDALADRLRDALARNRRADERTAIAEPGDGACSRRATIPSTPG